MKKLLLQLLVLCLMCSVYAEQIRFACVGNSITSGSGNPKTDPETYPAQLRVLMGPDYDIQNFGVSG